MNKILAIIRKDILVRFSSRSELLFFLVLPLVFTFVIGGGFGGPDEPSRIRLLVVDRANTALSARLLEALARSEIVSAEVLPQAEAEQEFADRSAPALLVIPAGFDASLELEMHAQPNDLNAQAAGRAVSVIAGQVGLAAAAAQGSVNEAERLRPFTDDAGRQAYYAEAFSRAQSLLSESPDRLNLTRPESPTGTPFDPAAQASAGQLITWVFIPLLGISALFAFERQSGSLRRLLATPTRKSTFLFGAIGGQVLISLVQMALLVTFGVWVMKLNWGQSPAALALLLFAIALTGAALGTALGAFVKTERQASGLSIMLGMVLALLGGCWYPLELFPQAARTVVNILPTTWAMQGLMDLLVRGQDLSGILVEAGVLLGFAVVFFAVGVWRLRYE
jgi:ABC-2 type transport system permease protein